MLATLISYAIVMLSTCVPTYHLIAPPLHRLHDPCRADPGFRQSLKTTDTARHLGGIHSHPILPGVTGQSARYGSSKS
jgi:hypothetical protein